MSDLLAVRRLRIYNLLPRFRLIPRLVSNVFTICYRFQAKVETVSIQTPLHVIQLVATGKVRLPIIEVDDAEKVFECLVGKVTVVDTASRVLLLEFALAILKLKGI